LIELTFWPEKRRCALDEADDVDLGMSGEELLNGRYRRGVASGKVWGPVSNYR
jgi:hypothetical protein